MTDDHAESQARSRAELQGSGAIAQGEGAVAAGAGGIAIGGDVHGDVTVTIQGENVRDKELAYLDGLLARYEYWRDHYTPLAGIAEVRAAVEDGPRLDLPMPFIPPGFEKLVEHGYGERVEVRREPVDDLRAAVAEHRRIVLLGDPGSGKTTTLWRLAYDYANAARADGRAPLPLLVPLGRYTGDDPFDAHLARHLGPLAPYLETYRASGRLILLLDGLNEMPRAGYAERVERIRDVLERQPGEAVVVTCRALDYVARLERLQQVEVSPLDEARIQAFLHNYLGETAGERLFWAMCGDEVRALWDAWQRAGGPREAFWTAGRMPGSVYARTTRAQKRLWERLWEEPPPLLALGRNPYLLLMTAQVYARAGGKLPSNRARLFAAFVDTLLGREEKRHPEGWIEAGRQKDGLAALAYAMQAERGSGTTVERGWAAARLCGLVPESDAERLLYLAASATLLDADDATVRFYHQLLQEYFAACELGRRVAAGEPLERYWPPERWWEPSGWEETAILLAGMEEDASALLERLTSINPVVAARSLVEGGARAGEGTHRAVVAALVGTMASGRQPAVARVGAGRALAPLGDPRFRKDAWHLPDGPLLGFVEVPAGPFVMGTREEDIPSLEERFGSRRGWYERETPQHEVTLPGYYIARYPVTVAQFRAFVDTSGYRPGDADGLRGVDNHPVVWVAWNEALAYCRWLTKTLREWEGTPEPLARLLREEGWEITLPSEAEWEKAARGADGWLFSWGAGEDPNRANYGETGIGTTSAVGCFPGGASPYGVEDLGGNVQEWTRSLYEKYPYNPEDGRENLEAGGFRVLRGGWSSSAARFVRCTCRVWFYPNYRSRDYGFRVVASPVHL